MGDWTWQDAVREEERYRLGQQHTSEKIAARAATGRAAIAATGNGHPEVSPRVGFCGECRWPHVPGSAHPRQPGWWLE